MSKRHFGAPSDDFLTGKLGGRDVVFPAAAWARTSHYAQRTESSREYLGDEEAGRGMDHQRQRSRFVAGEIQALRHRASPIILRPHQASIRAHIFWARHRRRTSRLPNRFAKNCANCCLTNGRRSARVHDGGTYVNMEGPAFSTRAESHGQSQTRLSMSSA